MQLTLARRGELDVDDLDLEWLEAIRLHDLVELTHWTLDEINDAPAILIDRLLLVAKATAEASKPREST